MLLLILINKHSPILITGFIIASLPLIYVLFAKAKYRTIGFHPKDLLNSDEYFLKSKTALLNGFLISWSRGFIEETQIQNNKIGRLINISMVLALITIGIYLSVLGYGVIR